MAIVATLRLAPSWLATLNAMNDSSAAAGTVGWDALKNIVVVKSCSGEEEIKRNKVYRNTRQVVEFARSLGFAVEVPAGLPGGPDVARHESVADEVTYCRAVVEAAEGRLVGVLAKEAGSLAKIREAFAGHSNVKVMTVEQAQGVEFDTVILLGLADFLADQKGYADAALAAERARVNRDLLYVAITRAMRELHVVK